MPDGERNSLLGSCYCQFSLLFHFIVYQTLRVGLDQVGSFLLLAAAACQLVSRAMVRIEASNESTGKLYQKV